MFVAAAYASPLHSRPIPQIQRVRRITHVCVSAEGPSSSEPSRRERGSAASGRPGGREPRLKPETRPVIEELIIVEGTHDAKVVQRAVVATVFTTNGTLPANPAKGYQIAPTVIAKLQRLSAAHPGVIILSDPDLGGRLMRRRVEELLAPRVCRHAFVPADEATCLETEGYKEEGDLGVEFASTAIVRVALLGARDAAADRAEFTKDDLVRWRLAGEHGKPPPPPDEVSVDGEPHLRGVGERRDLVGLSLGFGACGRLLRSGHEFSERRHGDGAQFLKQLNRYGFSRADVEGVLSELDQHIVVARPPAAPVLDAPSSSVVADSPQVEMIKSSDAPREESQ